jgi:hypothetical protein
MALLRKKSVKGEREVDKVKERRTCENHSHTNSTTTLHFDQQIDSRMQHLEALEQRRCNLGRARRVFVR